jgi:hypothetical protein
MPDNWACMPSPFVIPRVLHLADASDAGVAQGGGQEKKRKRGPYRKNGTVGRRYPNGTPA